VGGVKAGGLPKGLGIIRKHGENSLRTTRGARFKRLMRKEIHGNREVVLQKTNEEEHLGGGEKKQNQGSSGV